MKRSPKSRFRNCQFWHSNIITLLFGGDPKPPVCTKWGIQIPTRPLSSKTVEKLLTYYERVFWVPTGFLGVPKPPEPLNEERCAAQFQRAPSRPKRLRKYSLTMRGSFGVPTGAPLGSLGVPKPPDPRNASREAARFKRAHSRPKRLRNY